MFSLPLSQNIFVYCTHLAPKASTEHLLCGTGAAARLWHFGSLGSETRVTGAQHSDASLLSGPEAGVCRGTPGPRLIPTQSRTREISSLPSAGRPVENWPRAYVLRCYPTLSLKQKVGVWEPLGNVSTTYNFFPPLIQ